MSRLLLAAAFVATFISPSNADEQDSLKIGVQPDGRIVVPTNQILKPAGKQITFPGRPVDLAFTDEGRTLVIKNMRDLVFLDVVSGAIKQTLKLPVPPKADPKPGLSVVGLAVHSDRIYASDAQSEVRVAVRGSDGKYEWAASIALDKPKVDGLPHGSGLALFGKEELWVLSTRGNNVQRMALATGKVEQMLPVGVAPFQILFAGPSRAYVSNWGGNPPAQSDPQALSSKTPVRIDPETGVANHGSLSVLAPVEGIWKQVKTIRVGLHPSGMALSRGGKLLYVANANSDTVSVIDTRTDAVVECIACRPEARLPFGSGCNALALSPDGGTLYVANGTNNCVAVVRLGAKASEAQDTERPDKSALLGLIPTGWYPGAIQVSSDGKKLFVANIKGHGALSQPRPVAKGKNSHDHLGSLSIIDVPDDKQLAEYTKEVNANNRLAYSLAGLEKPAPATGPLPVPRRHGEPSLFKHVLYIIKENRTYDQVFGDLKEGNGDPNLVLFGEEVTPNHHALARQFTLFDNFYCSGVLSADGHTWVNEAYVSDYMERAFGGWTRSYPDDGSDPLAYVPTGFLWESALRHKRTLRDYGEYVKTEYPKHLKWTDYYTDFTTGAFKLKGTVSAKANIKLLEPHAHPNYPWFPLLMPDVYRAHLFIEELKQFEKKGELPDLVYVTLPCDHTDGTRPGYPTPRAMVADNDLALGRIVEAVSKSKFWKDTCIFIVEDDPQNGFDHVDGHRTVALAISPYTKRKFVDHTNYNQTGMVKTIELMLGLPPMNQLDLSATPMRICFQNEADLTPYTAVANKIQLDEMNPSLKALNGKALHWAKKSVELDLDDGDAADEDTLNRILWHAVRGYETPYPEAFAGRKVE
jgi:YVTN family beta-propeller protein